jgi:hypothetical protein
MALPAQALTEPALDQDPRNSLEHFITLQMAMLVIIKFKIVHIAHDRAKTSRRSATRCAKPQNKDSGTDRRRR